jgi:hypothetical protein
MLKKLFYASASILMLAIAYHLGAATAAAQAPGNPVVAVGATGGVVYAANGDAYLQMGGPGNTTFTLLGNVFSGPTPAAHATWGQLKTNYHK